MSDFPREETNRVVRLPDRGHYDRETIYAILDEALICHVAFHDEERPVVIPTLHARDGDNLLLHGASSSRLLRHLASGASVSVAVTLIDGLVLARSIFHHSINYRSVVLFGRGQAVAEFEKLALLQRFAEKLVPGRWDAVRQPNPQELKATGIVRLPIALASAKVRTGGPKDDAEDLALPVWAGVVPVVTRRLPAVADTGELPIPEHVRALYAA